MGEISLSYIDCEMILAMLSNFLWASSLMESCFSCFTVKVLKDFCVMPVARERSSLVPLKEMPTANPTPLTNAAIEIPPVITVDIINPVYNSCNCIELFHFFSNPFSDFNILKQICFNFSHFFKRYVCGSCGAVGF